MFGFKTVQTRNISLHLRGAKCIQVQSRSDDGGKTATYLDPQPVEQQPPRSLKRIVLSEKRLVPLFSLENRVPSIKKTEKP